MYRMTSTRSICCGSVRRSTMFFRLRGDAGTETKEAAYGSGLQYMSWNGWLGRMAQSRCRKVVDTASRPVSAQQPHTGAGRPSHRGAYRSRRRRYGLVREPQWRGAVGAHQHQWGKWGQWGQWGKWGKWGCANDLVAGHRPGRSQYSLCRHAPGGGLSLTGWWSAVGEIGCGHRAGVLHWHTL